MTIKPPSATILETLHGHVIADPYRPLENLDAPATLAWAKAQTQRTETETHDPAAVAAYIKRAKEVIDYPTKTTPERYGTRRFFETNTGLQDHEVVMLQEGDAEPTPLIDPNTWPLQQAKALDGFEISPNGKYMAVFTSKKGGDWMTLEVMDIDTKAIIDTGFKPCRFTELSWSPDSKSFVYSLPTASRAAIQKGGNPKTKVFYHVVGADPATDMLYYEPPADPKDKRQAYCSISFDEKTGDEFLTRSFGTELEEGRFWRPPGGEWKEITPPDFTTLDIVVGGDGFFYGYTTLNAPRGRVVRIDPQNPQPENWQTLIPEHKTDLLASFGLMADKLAVTWKRDLADHLEIYAKTGDFLRTVPLPAMSSIELEQEHEDDRWAYVTVTSPRAPYVTYVYDFDKDTLVFHEKAKIRRDLTGESIVVEQAFATSKDGTRVPMTIIYDRDKVKLDGTAATRMYGYGTYGEENPATFTVGLMNWVEDGGIYVNTNIRGGGEYGRDWHLSATGLNKQKSYDDFIACAEYLHQNNYTSPARLGIEGGSAGGLLVLATSVQRPDLFGAVISEVPVTDMLRFHLSTAGGGWIADFGDPDIRADFENILTFSPLHTIQKGQTYPPQLVTTGDHDDRVEPWHAYKYVATMQATSPDTRCYLHVDSDAGHSGGVGLDKQIEVAAKTRNFWTWAMGPIDQTEYKLWKATTPTEAGRPVTPPHLIGGPTAHQ